MSSLTLQSAWRCTEIRMVRDGMIRGKMLRIVQIVAVRVQGKRALVASELVLNPAHESIVTRKVISCKLHSLKLTCLLVLSLTTLRQEFSSSTVTSTTQYLQHGMISSTSSHTSNILILQACSIPRRS